MASVVYFRLLALVILARFVLPVDSYLKRYISVVSDVHEFSRTSSVFFVIPQHSRSLEDYTSLYSLSRDFSQKAGGFPSIIHFDQLGERAERYRKPISRSLLVIFLRSLSDIAEFTEKFMSKSYTWLVIFTDEAGSSALCEYCKFPKGNDFGLRFDTEMMVLCCDSLILKEWWSADGHQTEVSDLATWKDKYTDKFTLIAPAGFDTRRHDLKGAGLRIGLVEASSLAYEADGEIRGFFGHILKELMVTINFTITEVIRSPAYGAFDPKTNEWTNAIGRVLRRDVDLACADFIISKVRLGLLDFTLPLAVSKDKLYIKVEEDDRVYWAAYFQAFSIIVWIVLILLIIFASTLLGGIKCFRTSGSLPSLMAESYVEVWGIFCQQGLQEFPTETSLRIAQSSICILAVVIYAAYGASLVSFLTISSSGLPFTTLEGFVEDGSYRLIVLKGTATYSLIAYSNHTIFKRMMKLMKPEEELPESFANAWEQVCQGKVALYCDTVPEIRSQVTPKCKVTMINSPYENDLAMVMRHANQYSSVINYHIQRFKDTGVMERIRSQYYNSTHDPEQTTFEAFQLYDVAPVMVILTVGIILASLVLLSEVIYNILKKNLSSKRYRNKFWKNVWK